MKTIWRYEIESPLPGKRFSIEVAKDAEIVHIGKSTLRGTWNLWVMVPNHDGPNEPLDLFWTFTGQLAEDHASWVGMIQDDSGLVYHLWKLE